MSLEMGLIALNGLLTQIVISGEACTGSFAIFL